MTRAALFSICFASLFVAGCFEAPKPACAFLCGDDGACPDDYSCRPDGWCKRTGSGNDMVPDSFTCDDTLLPTIDADTTPDAPTDATPVDAAAFDAGFALGSSCTTGDQCNSGFCSDLVCCDAACTGDCDACSVTAGSSADGSCDLLPSSVVCRADAGDCDIAESCTGSSADCPTDVFETVDTACGSATDDDCTNPDTCNATGTCLDNHETATAQCTDTLMTDCDDAQCDGSGTCVQDGGVELSSFECRASAGDCDIADKCNGSDGGTCPSDVFESSGVQCTDSSPTNCEDAQCNGAGLCVQDFGDEAMNDPCGPGVAEPTCNPDVCDAVGVCTDVAALADESACTEVSSGDCCGGVCTDTSGSGDMCP